MKQRQRVPKSLVAVVTITMLAIVLMFFMAPEVKAQTTPRNKPKHSQAKDFAKVQASKSWENYQNTWLKIELEKAKENKKLKKEAKATKRKTERMKARIQALKQD